MTDSDIQVTRHTSEELAQAGQVWLLQTADQLQVLVFSWQGDTTAMKQHAGLLRDPEAALQLLYIRSC